MLKNRRAILRAIGAASVAGWPIWAHALRSDTPVKLVVPFAPGGATDIIARVIAPRLSGSLGTSFVVLNTPGAAGAVGAGTVANAKSDGHTLLLYHTAIVTAPLLQQHVGFNPIESFTPIGLIAEASNVVAVNPNVPARNFAELVALAKSKPGKMNYGSSGIGGGDHLGGELLQKVTGIELGHIPYKGGGPATTAVVAGEVEITAATMAQAMPMIKAGKLRPLVVMQPDRAEALPDVPSAAEAGFPTLNHKIWFGLWSPAGMNPGDVERINTALNAVLKEEEVRQAFRNVGVDVRGSTSREFGAHVRSQQDLWRSVLSAGRK